MPQFKKFSTMPFCQDGILPRWHFRLFFLCLRLNSSNFLKQHFSKMALSFFYLCPRLDSSIFQKRLFPRWHFCAIFLSLSTPRFKQWSKMTSVWKPLLFSMPKFKYSSFQRLNFCEKCFPSSTPRFWQLSKMAFLGNYSPLSSPRFKLFSTMALF